jgi:competence protein ComEA
MVVRGAKATDEEIRQVTDYLATNLAYVPGQVKLPDGPGKEAFVKVCSGCHAPDNVVGRDGHEGKLASWISTVDRMIYRGAHGTDTEYDQIAEYLATNFGYIPVTSQLPPGPGKETVEKICAQCHGVTLFIGRAEPRGSWDRMIANMIGRGARGTAEEFEQVAQYLTKTFGPDNAKVYVNRLTADELETELGVSAAEARAIVSYRESNGNIKDWQDLTGVPGFDAAKISVKNKDRLMF